MVSMWHLFGSDGVALCGCSGSELTSSPWTCPLQRGLLTYPIRMTEKLGEGDPRVRSFQLHEVLDFHVPFQFKKVYGMLEMGLTGSLAAPGSTLDCTARTSGA